MGKIIVVGSINMDVVINVPHIPSIGETIIAKEVKFFSGGKGANQAIAAARLGGKVYMIGKLGKDENGQALYEKLKENNVDTEGILFDDSCTTGTAYINVGSKGENSIVVNQGANGKLSIQDIKDKEHLFEAGDICVMQLEIPIDVVKYVLDLCRAKDIKIVLNPAPADTKINEYLKDVFIVIPNESELSILTDSKIDDKEDLLKGSKILLDKGAVNVLTTLGEKGSIFVNDDVYFFTDAIAVQPKDTTAAGDSFIGAFCVAIGEGLSVRGAIRFATYTSALTVTKEGAQESLPTREEVEALIKNL